MSTEMVEAPVRQQAPVPRQRTATVPTSSLFRVIWRWHFYAGLIVSPVIMVAALTGGIYLFGAEIVDVANRRLLFVDAIGDPLPCPALIQAAEAAIPGGKASRIASSADPRRSVAVTVKPPPEVSDASQASDAADQSDARQERGSTVFVDPYTASVLGTSSGPLKLQPFFALIRHIHQRLYAGTFGRVVVELATTWTLILILSGLYLWWPRRREKLKGVWLPRWPAKPYTVLRDLHAMAGVYLMPVCLIIIISGLFYTLVWGESFHFISKALLAESAAADELASAEDQPQDAPPQPYVAPAFTLQQAVTKARVLYPGRDVTVTLPTQSTDHYEVSSINDYARGTYGAMNSTGFKLHRESGEVLDTEHLSDNERYWWHAWAYPLHVGSVLGPFSKAVWLAASIALIALPFTGLWMWWKRRPRGGSGFPRKPSFDVVPLWVRAAIVLLSVLLPMFGISVLLMIAADQLTRVFRPGQVAAG